VAVARGKTRRHCSCRSRRFSSTVMDFGGLFCNFQIF
jgi:hypothetical protein